MSLRLIFLLAASALPIAANAADLPIPVVAAEGFYGEVATAIGGDRVAVQTVAISPDADPHDFAPPPSVARTVADAVVVLLNGVDYDHWMEQLLEASTDADRVVLDVAALVGAEEGGNPHLWYDPRPFPALAGALAATLSAVDPDGAAHYERRFKDYTASLEKLNRRIESDPPALRGHGVAGDRAGLRLHGRRARADRRRSDFQNAIMNETEPSAKDIAGGGGRPSRSQGQGAIYNTQVTDAMTEQLLAVAGEAERAGGRRHRDACRTATTYVGMDARPARRLDEGACRAASS